MSGDLFHRREIETACEIEERRSALLEQPRKEESQCFAVLVLRRHSFPDGKNVVKQQAFPFRSLQCRQRFFMIQTKQMTVVRESYPPTPATCRCGSEDQMPLTESVTKHTTGQNCCTRTELQGLRPRQLFGSLLRTAPNRDDNAAR